MPDDVARIPDDALPACCVRIDVGASPAGTGFFVAPGVVVTCNHVVELERVSSGEADSQISVVSADGTVYEVLDDRERSPTDEDDLAVLRVAPTDEHPCALLDTGLWARDELHTYGYPANYPRGAPTTLGAEGWMERDRWLKIKDGQIQPGMSGSPVLNLRTGAVCGVLKRTRDAASNLGGYAVSVRCLFRLSPMLESLNYRHHTTYRDSWFALLPPKERRVLEAQRSSGATVTPPRYVLVISVDQVTLENDETDWNVSATLHTRESKDGDGDDDGSGDYGWRQDDPLGPVSVDLNGVRALVARVFRDWASREGSARGRVEPGEQIRLLGSIISKGLLRDVVGDEFERLAAEIEPDWMEVAVHFADVDDDDFREFVQLPWEHLYLPKRRVGGEPRSDLYFARDHKVALVRTLLPEPAIVKPRPGKLSVLVLAVVPPKHPGTTAEDMAAASGILGIADHMERLSKTLEDSLDMTVLRVPPEDPFREFATGYDVVHYIGYGRLAEGTDRIAMGADPGAYGVNAGGFADCLAERVPSLVVLQFCRGSEEVPADLAVFAPPLLIKGCGAVIANQYPVVHDPQTLYPVRPEDEQDETVLNEAQKFNRWLYTLLVSGVTVELAAQTARKKVWSGDQESRAFVSPAVFVRHPGGLKLVAKGREKGLRSRVGALPAHA